MRTIKTYSKRAPFYNALSIQGNSGLVLHGSLDSYFIAVWSLRDLFRAILAQLPQLRE